MGKNSKKNAKASPKVSQPVKSSKSTKTAVTVPTTPAYTPAAREAQMAENAQVYVTKNFDSLFKIDTKGTGLPVKTSKPVISANKQPIILPKSERKKIEKIRRHVLPRTVHPHPSTNLPKGILSAHNTTDVWATTPLDSRPKPILKSSIPTVNPAVIHPVSGHSYNPRLEDHLNLIKDRVEAETIRKPLDESQRNRRIAKKIQTADRQINASIKNKRLEQLGRNGRAHYVESQRLRQEKAKDVQEKQIGELISARDNRLRQQALKLQATKVRRDRIADAITKGHMRVTKLANSKHNLPETKAPDFVLPADLPKSFKDTAGTVSDAVRDRFDSIYRRGLIEYKPIAKAQRMAKYGLHNRQDGPNVFIDGQQ